MTQTVILTIICISCCSDIKKINLNKYEFKVNELML